MKKLLLASLFAIANCGIQLHSKEGIYNLYDNADAMRGKEIAETCWNHVLEHNINAYGYDKKTDVYFLCQSEKAAGCLNFNYGIIIWIGGSSDDTCVISAHEFGHEIQLELGLSLAEPYIPTDRQDSCMKTSYLYQECSR